MEEDDRFMLDQGDAFESALSSMVSSSISNDVIGRLGTISNAEISHPLTLSSSFPPPTHLHPGFATNNTLKLVISGSKSTVQESRDNKSINVELGDSRENSTVSDQIPSANSRKRKGKAKAKAKGTDSNNGESGAKRSKSEQQEDDLNLKQSSSSSSKPPEPPKDYIHVRARRGQATDAHSLAERVRREKISERMKLLQDLVPGCNKVTGKAVMLDEIINYVQSLQRQVEFLSMKLAVVNPRMDSKDVLSWEKNNIYPWDHSLYHFDPQSNLHNGIVIGDGGGSETQASFWNQTLHLPPRPIHNFTNTTSAASQVQASTIWEDDLHSFVQMGFGQNLRQSNHANGIQMKVELS